MKLNEKQKINFYKTHGFKIFLKAALFVFFMCLIISALRGAEYVVLILAAALIHESGHILTAKFLGVPFSKASGGLFGFSLKYDFSGKSYLTQTIVSLAGAFFNVIACVITLTVFKNTGYRAAFFIFSNIAPAMFNLMPISPLDGSGVLLCLLSMLVNDPAKAEKAVCRVSFVFSLAFFFLTVYIQMKIGVNLSLMIISVLLIVSCIKSNL